jgi:acyl-homoserine-lactone acylase
MRNLRLRRAVVAVSTGLALCALVAAPTAGAVAGARVTSTVPARRVTITTDSAGIPHITAANFFDLGYGEAWAFSEDNFCTLAQDFVTVEGDRSRYFGPDGSSIDYSAGTDYTNLDSDLFWKEVRASGLIQHVLSTPPPVGPLPQVLRLYRGYVAGYNAYLASGRLNDPTCKGQPWVRPIDLTDVLLRDVQITTEASSQQFISDEVAAAPPTSSSAAPAAGPIDPSALRQLRENPESTNGSNGIGLGSEDTRSGNGMVLANPHFPWRGTERFWMVQLTVPGQYDVEGGTLEGFPLVGIGFNRDLAWTHTVSTDWRFTFYQLHLVPGHPTSYYYNGRVEKMGTETVHVDNGSGTTTHTFYTTRFGTVIDLPEAGYDWTSTNAYTLDDATLSDARAANEYLRMGQATSVRQLLHVEETYLGIPTFNTIAADDHGNTLYADMGATPAVSRSLIHACLPKGTPTLVYAVAGVITLDGSRSRCRWADEAHTPVRGILNGSELPHTIRKDYVENSNDSYWLANPQHPFRAYSPIVGNIDVEQNLRTRLGNQLIAKRVAGTDGLGPPKFTIKTLQKMWEGDESELADLVLHSLVGACRKTPEVTASNGATVDLTRACDVLAHYNGTGDLGASGGWLFSEWYARAPSTDFWANNFNSRKPLTTPSKLDTKNPAILQALADAVQALQAQGVPLDASYRQVQYYPAADGAKIPIPGCDTGCFNAIYTADGLGSALEADPYGEVYDGSSLVITTELTSHGPSAEGILTYSQATNPNSPWYSNMTKLYAHKQWVHLPYTAKQLAEQAGNTSVTLSVP